MPAIHSLTDTWNAGGTTFDAIGMDVTDTASAADSKLLNLEVGGISKFAVGKDGAIGIAGDVILTRDAANTLAQRNGTNAQVFRVYNTFTDASNYERGELLWAANTLSLTTGQAGTGVARNLALNGALINLNIGGVNTWQVSTAGNLVPSGVNSRDLGTTAIPVRNGFFGLVAVDADITPTSAVTVATNSGGIGNARYGTDVNGALFTGFKTRTNTGTNANTVLVSGDNIVQLRGYGADGAAYQQGGNISLRVDGTPGASDMPGRWEFATTPDGSATPAVNMIINNAGDITAGQTSGTGTGRMIGAAFQTPDTTIAGLPAPSAANKGQRRHVTNGSAPTFLGIVGTTGAIVAPVFSDGTNWVYG
jgi:hypothetical protein